jgi:hypothetical protein
MKNEQTQQNELILTNPEAARASRESVIFPQFPEPKSPSDVAKNGHGREAGALSREPIVGAWIAVRGGP